MADKSNSMRSKIKRNCHNCRFLMDNCPTDKPNGGYKKPCKHHKFNDFWVKTSL